MIADMTMGIGQIMRYAVKTARKEKGEKDRSPVASAKEVKVTVSLAAPSSKDHLR
jgi:hypothetical protein